MQKKSIRELVLVALVAIVIVLFIIGLDNAVIPLIVSSILAYACLPIVKKIEKEGKLNRPIATGIVLFIGTLIFIVLVVTIIPPLFADLRDAAIDAPKNISIALEKLDNVLSEYGIHVPYDRQSLVQFAGHFSEQAQSEVLQSATNFIKKSVSNFGAVIVVLLNISLIPIFFFYVIKDSEKIGNEARSLIPLAWRPKINEILGECNVVLSGYIRGQLLVCFILGVLYSAGLMIVGVKFAIVIGFMTGFFSFIPYVGFSFGYVAAIITALANFEGAGPLVGVTIAYGIIQFFESFFITPMIVGDKVGLSPFEAILSMIVLGNLIGFIGLFLAIPIGAIVKILFRHLMREYKRTSFFKA